MNKIHTIQVRLTPQQYEAIQTLSSINHLNTSQYIRKCIEEQYKD